MKLNIWNRDGSLDAVETIGPVFYSHGLKLFMHKSSKFQVAGQAIPPPVFCVSEYYSGTLICASPDGDWLKNVEARFSLDTATEGKVCANTYVLKYGRANGKYIHQRRKAYL